MREADFEGLQQSTGLCIDTHTSRPADVIFEFTNLAVHSCKINGSRTALNIGQRGVQISNVIVAVFEQFIEEIGVDFIASNELLDCAGILVRFFTHSPESLQHDFQRASERIWRRCEHFTHDKNEQMPLPTRKRVVFLPLKKRRYRFVKFVLIIARCEWPRDEPALRVFDVFQHVFAQRAPTERTQSLTQPNKVAASICIPGAKRWQIAEELFINECRKSVEFDE